MLGSGATQWEGLGKCGRRGQNAGLAAGRGSDTPLTLQARKAMLKDGVDTQISRDCSSKKPH